MPEGPSCRPAPTISSSSSDASDECAAEEEYMLLVARYPFDEEVLEWVLREQRERATDDFVPARGTCNVCRASSCAGCNK